MAAKIYETAERALAGVVRDGATIMVGGFGLCGMPATLVRALRDTGAKNLTCVSNNAGIDGEGLWLLLQTRQIRKMISSYVGDNELFARQYLSGELEVEFCPQGTLAERCRAGGAGIGAFYTRTGYGAPLTDGKQTLEINGEMHVLEHAIRADLALIKAEIADENGNLVYRKTARNFNPDMAMCPGVTVAEVERIVPSGSIDPDHVHTPGIFVQRIVLTRSEKRLERASERRRSA